MKLYRRQKNYYPEMNRTVPIIVQFNNQGVSHSGFWNGEDWIYAYDGDEVRKDDFVCWLEEFEVTEDELHGIICGKTTTSETGLKAVDDVMEFLSRGEI